MKPWYVTATAILVGLTMHCAHPLDGSENEPITEGPQGRTYTNQSLGFQITIPTPLDTSWGMSVQTFHHTGFLADGTTLSVYITGPRGRAEFQPTLSLLPFPVGRGTTLSDLATQAVNDFKASYTNYREAAHQTATVGNVPAVQWTFTTRNQGGADRYTVTLLTNGNLGYLMQGSGIEGYYPLDDYARILKTFKLF